MVRQSFTTTSADTPTLDSLNPVGGSLVPAHSLRLSTSPRDVSRPLSEDHTVSNIFTSLSEANNKLAALQAMGATAASQISAGALSHGTGAILEVALISSAIWQGALSYEVDKTTVSFDIEKATAAARLTYGRYAEVYGHGKGSPFATKGAMSLAGWRARVLAMLHPFTWNEEAYDWRLSLEQAVKEVMKLSAGKSPAKIIQMDREVRDAFDATVKLRAKAQKFFDYACLYCALDDNGSLLQNSVTDITKVKSKDFGLLMTVSFFIPPGKVPTILKADGVVVLMPVDQRSGAITHATVTTKTVGEKVTTEQSNEDTTRVSFASLHANWLAKTRKVEAKPTNAWVDAVRLLKTLTPDMDLHGDAIASWDDMFVKVLAFNNALNVKRGKAPEPEAPMTVVEQARAISGRLAS
jgi:hypothetical protein